MWLNSWDDRIISWENQGYSISMFSLLPQDSVDDWYLVFYNALPQISFPNFQNGVTD